jgi:hypothetical protein
MDRFSLAHIKMWADMAAILLKSPDSAKAGLILGESRDIMLT